MSAKPYYVLLENGVAPGQVKGGLEGGDYAMRADASSWAGGSVKLQYLALDGTTWIDLLDASVALVSLAANGAKMFPVGQGAVVKATVTGAPVGLNVVLGGI